uniref:Uncharacterized protein n=1 Tax=Physcomitrium patens TaxID=3218 RepID=A9RGM0_PHYPA|nr:hypothetical protein PHYPA_011254 [Physcomitrium patens]
MQNLFLSTDGHHVDHHASSPHRRPYNPSPKQNQEPLRCNFCGEENHFMQNYLELALEIARRARDRRNQGKRGGRISNNHNNSLAFHSNLVIGEFAEPTPTSQPEALNLFNVALCRMDLK